MPAIAVLRNVTPGSDVVMTVAQLVGHAGNQDTKTVTVTEQYPAQNRTRVRVDSRMKMVDDDLLVEIA